MFRRLPRRTSQLNRHRLILENPEDEKRDERRDGDEKI
jgi:hypothetical protein